MKMAYNEKTNFFSIFFTFLRENSSNEMQANERKAIDAQR
jgi:hypothetical protein